DTAFDDRSDEGAERRLHRDAASATRRQRGSPVRFLADEVECGLQPWRLGQVGTAKRDRIHPGPMSEFVDEALDGEDGVVGPHAAPEAGDHARRLFAIVLHAAIVEVVWHVYR